jgi:hypothetical protein
VAALPAPNERERTQWYFQRYVAHLPAAARSCCSTAAGTTAPASSGDGLLHDEEYEEFFAPCPSSRDAGALRHQS